MPGNVFVPAIASGLPRDSVVNVTALVTLDKTDLDPAVGRLPTSLMHEVDRGLRRVLGLLATRPFVSHTRPPSGDPVTLVGSACAVLDGAGAAVGPYPGRGGGRRGG
jgi:hypothetical protein